MFELFSLPPTWFKVVIWLAVGLPVAFGMEGWARVLHGRLWHGVLWRFHESHHVEQPGYFELNDLFAVFHAAVAIPMMLYGCVGPEGWAREALFGLSLGMTAFGLSYAVVHDGLVHGRLPVAFLRRSAWIRRIEAAHKVHHRDGEAPYGLFRGPAEVRRIAAARRAARGGAA